MEKAKTVWWVLPYSALSTVGGEDDNGSNGGLEGPMQVGEALDVQHVDLINEEDARNQLSNALVNVLVHHLVNLLPQFVWNRVTRVRPKMMDKHQADFIWGGGGGKVDRFSTT